MLNQNKENSATNETPGNINFSDSEERYEERGNTKRKKTKRSTNKYDRN